MDKQTTMALSREHTSAKPQWWIQDIWKGVADVASGEWPKATRAWGVDRGSGEGLCPSPEFFFEI